MFDQLLTMLLPLLFTGMHEFQYECLQEKDRGKIGESGFTHDLVNLYFNSLNYNFSNASESKLQVVVNLDILFYCKVGTKIA